jgi:hypothetical protein
VIVFYGFAFLVTRPVGSADRCKQIHSIRRDQFDPIPDVKKPRAAQSTARLYSFHAWWMS